MVVLHHTIRALTIKSRAGKVTPWLIDNPKFYDTLAIGVDLFFVISGFIMVYVSSQYLFEKRPVSDFLSKRALRIYPTYLLVALALGTLVAVQAFLAGRPNFDLGIVRLIGDITLFPTFNKFGIVAPQVGVGWTLSYEIYFYLIFAFCVFAFRRSFFLPLALIMIAVLIAATFLSPRLAIVAFFQNSIAFEFIFGCAIGLLVRRGMLCPAPIVMLVVAVSAIIVLPVAEFGDCFRFLTWGLPAALALYAVISLEIGGIIKSPPRALLFLGNASYSVYLTHILAVNMVGTRIGQHLNAMGVSSVMMLFAALAIAMIATVPGLLLYLVWEKPVAAVLSRAGRPRPA